MPRIGFADHLFLRMHHGIGNPIFNQFLWRFDGTFPVSELEKLHADLSKGLLSRRVEGPYIPTARHVWVASPYALPLDASPAEIEPDTIRCWAESRISDRLDPEAGLGWQLSVAHIRGGGTVVSLVCSHMIADGAAMVAAVRHAVGGAAGVGAADLGARAPVVRGLIDDVLDTAGQAKPIAMWAAKKAIAAVRRTPSATPAVPAAEPPHRTPIGTNSDPWSPPYVVVECDAASWHSAAAEWGGTSNSLFIGVLTAVSEALGRARPGDVLRWSLPYNDRGADDLDSNSTKIIPVRVPVAERDDRDLTHIRKASKVAFTDFAARRASGGDSAAIPLPLIQMLPDVLVAKLPTPSDGAEGLCSNMGKLPEDFVALGGVRARSIAARATFEGADAAFARSLGGGTTAWAAETDDAVTVTLHGMDPDRIGTDEQFRDVVSEVLGRWNITHRFW